MSSEQSGMLLGIR